MTITYDVKHMQFLQHFMDHRLVSENDAIKINKLLFHNKDIDTTINLINSKITPLEFKINKTVCEQNGDVNYVFIATFFDDFNSKKDLNKVMFTQLVNHIIEAGGSITYDDATSFHSNVTNDILDAFFDSKYLLTDDEKNIFLSPLAISELEGYLADKFPDKTCMGCMKFVVHGIKCQSCGKFVHRQCLTEYFKNSGTQNCLKCTQRLSVDCNPITINY